MSTQRAVTLLDGTQGIVRAIRPSDRDALVAGWEALSPESRVRRYLFNKNWISESELGKLTSPDGVDHIALGLAVNTEDGTEQPIAVARCFRDQREKDLAEIAIVTADEWQSVGAGTELMRSLSHAALQVGIKRWLAAMLSDNTAMHRLLARFGELREKRDLGNGVVEAIYEIIEPEWGFFA